MNFSWLLSGEIFPAFALYLFGAFITNNVFTFLTFHRIHDNKFTAWANKILINLIVAKDWSELIAGINALIRQTKSQNRLSLLQAIANFVQILTKSTMVYFMRTRCLRQEILLLVIRKQELRTLIDSSLLLGMFFLVDDWLLELLRLLKDSGSNLNVISKPVAWIFSGDNGTRAACWLSVTQDIRKTRYLWLHRASYLTLLHPLPLCFRCFLMVRNTRLLVFLPAFTRNYFNSFTALDRLLHQPLCPRFDYSRLSEGLIGFPQWKLFCLGRGVILGANSFSVWATYRNVGFASALKALLGSLAQALGRGRWLFHDWFWGGHAKNCTLVRSIRTLLLHFILRFWLMHF